MSRLVPGDVVAPRELVAIDGRTAPVPAASGLVHVQFRRFAGCPYCNLHIRSLVLRRAELDAAGIHEVLVFHSTREELLRHQSDVPFAIVPDPSKRLYREFGVESSWLADVHPRAWGPGLRGVLRKPGGVAADRSGGIRGLPADFLIGPGGRIVAAGYGRHAYDQWPVDEILRLAATAAVTGAP